jgi:hypothetical protein
LFGEVFFDFEFSFGAAFLNCLFVPCSAEASEIRTRGGKLWPEAAAIEVLLGFSANGNHACHRKVACLKPD